jgi:sugar transferase (PEP-CTERM system associated)
MILGDLLLAVLSVFAGFGIRGILVSEAGMHNPAYILPKAAIYSLLVVLASFYFDLYDTEKGVTKRETVLKIISAVFSASLVLGTIYYFLPVIMLWRGALLFAAIITVLTLSLWHILYAMLLKLPALSGRVLILGTGSLASKMGSLLETGNNGFTLAGYVSCMGEAMDVPERYIVGNGNGLLAVAQKERVQKIVVSLGERRGTLPVREVLDCKLNGIEVVDGPSFYEQLTGKLMIESINPSHIIFSEGFRTSAMRRYSKRIIDVILSIIGIVLAMPVAIVLAILIKIDSKGPVLFKQRRVGEGEKQFVLYKFRTMVEGAEETTGPVWSQDGDTRITRMGSLMRKTRIDEIPQLINVLKGDMSFIGPRPERPFFVETLKKQIPYYSERHCIKPGVTGWAQVKYQYGDSVEDAIEKLRYDLYYIKYQTLLLDLLIVLETFRVVLSGKGGR